MGEGFHPRERHAAHCPRDRRRLRDQKLVNGDGLNPAEFAIVVHCGHPDLIQLCHEKTLHEEDGEITFVITHGRPAGGKERQIEVRPPRSCRPVTNGPDGGDSTRSLVWGNTGTGADWGTVPSR